MPKTDHDILSPNGFEDSAFSTGLTGQVIIGNGLGGWVWESPIAKGSAIGAATNWTALGYEAGHSNTTGNYWTALGYEAGHSNTTGDYWTAVGHYAGHSNTTGSSWTAVGHEAGHSNTTGSNWTAVGRHAGYSNTIGSNWTAVGRQAGYSNTTGGYWTAVGRQAGYSNTTGNYWTALGYSAGHSNTIGQYWTAVGRHAGYSNTTGDYWTAVGHYAGRYIADGSTPLLTVNQSIFLGADTKALADNSQNEIVIGYNAIGHGDDTATIGNASTSHTHLAGQVVAESAAFSALPTSDPASAGALWNDSGTVKVSAG